MAEETEVQLAQDTVDDLAHKVKVASMQVRDTTENWDDLMRQLSTAKMKLKQLT